MSRCYPCSSNASACCGLHLSLPSAALPQRQLPPGDAQAAFQQRGGLPEEWRQALSRAASQRRWGLDVRYRMSLSHTGRKLRCPPAAAAAGGGDDVGS